jgi:hypothetical protein
VRGATMSQDAVHAWILETPDRLTEEDEAR